MYANVNLEGRVVNDPEIKTGKGDKKFVSFRIVVNQKYGEQEIASFFNCTGSELLAERLNKAGVKKGRLIHVNGNLSLREYTGNDGNQHLSADIGILDWHYTGTKPKTDGENADNAAPAQAATAGSVNPEQTIGDDEELPI